MASVISLASPRWVHQPDYELSFFRDGNPRAPISGRKIDLRSVVAIQTSKDLNDVAGTFTITVKDSAYRHQLREMDTVRIRLKGHYGGGPATVIKGVVDRVRAAGSSDTYAAQEDTVIEGRCAAKYLQVTSLFLPVWDPQAALPTALTFGLGDQQRKIGSGRPYDIFRYLVRKYTYGERDLAGVSGIPNSRYWLDHHTRFSKKLGFQIPFLQFDENSMAEALKRLEVLGYTESWVDELGRIVYRQPQWDAPIAYSIPTDGLISWDFDRGDVATATYVEVIPAGDPGIDSATAQALRAGRAPIPSSYLGKGSSTSLAGNVSPGFVIQTNSKGQVTKAGRQNHWYKLQRRLGVRPQQVTAPLLNSQEQAQAQAEGLLRFFSRATKGGTFTMPGCPQLRLGYNARVFGELDERNFDRTFYIEAISHDYVDGDHYTTNVTVTHGRDPWDEGFHRIALPKFDANALAQAGGGGVLDSGNQSTGSDGSGQTGNVTTNAGNGDFKAQTTRPDGKRVLPNSWLSDFLALLAGACGHTIETNTYSRHPQFSTSHLQSDHWVGNGADLNVTAHGGNWPNDYGMQMAFHAFRMCGLSVDGAGQAARGGGTYTRYPWKHNGRTYSVQILWGPNVGHVDHVHVGVRPA